MNIYNYYTPLEKSFLLQYFKKGYECLNSLYCANKNNFGKIDGINE